MSVYERLKNIHHLLFPSSCVLCGARAAGGEFFCGGCRGALPVLGPACARCAAPLVTGGAPDAVCGDCQQRPPAFDRVVAAYRYAPPLDRLIQGGKYNGRLDWLRVLARELLARLEAEAAAVDLLVPVPLHRSRLRERGYNQSLELARPLARRLGVAVVTTGIRRSRATAAQTGLSREAREKNVRRAFTVECHLENRRVAIVDDVMTSGATIEALARVLRRAGAARVEAWVLARAG